MSRWKVFQSLKEQALSRLVIVRFAATENRDENIFTKGHSSRLGYEQRFRHNYRRLGAQDPINTNPGQRRQSIFGTGDDTPLTLPRRTPNMPQEYFLARVHSASLVLSQAFNRHGETIFRGRVLVNLTGTTNPTMVGTSSNNPTFGPY